jgi:hypothetical protein
MLAKKFRWSHVYESPEEELVELLRTRNLQAQRIHVEMGANEKAYQTDVKTTLWCAEGSLMIEFGESRESLQPGDILIIDPAISYLLQPGLTGCVYYQTT